MGKIKALGLSLSLVGLLGISYTKEAIAEIEHSTFLEAKTECSRVLFVQEKAGFSKTYILEVYDKDNKIKFKATGRYDILSKLIPEYVKCQK